LLVDVRSGSTVNDLFKTITLGIQGTAMVPNLDAYKDQPERLWALAYYVRTLIDLKGTPTAIAIKDRLIGSMATKTEATPAAKEAAPEKPTPAPTEPTPAPIDPGPTGSPTPPGQ